jgi:hypothetical protein
MRFDAHQFRSDQSSRMNWIRALGSWSCPVSSTWTQQPEALHVVQRLSHDDRVLCTQRVWRYRGHDGRDQELGVRAASCWGYWAPCLWCWCLAWCSCTCTSTSARPTRQRSPSWVCSGGPWRAQGAPCCFYLIRSIICTIIESLSKEKRRMMVDHMSLAKKSLFEMDHDGQTHILWWTNA